MRCGDAESPLSGLSRCLESRRLPWPRVCRPAELASLQVCEGAEGADYPSTPRVQGSGGLGLFRALTLTSYPGLCGRTPPC